MVRRKLKLLKKQLVGLLICLSFSSCSLIGIWWYQSIDSYLESYFLEYAEFTDKQEAYIGKATKEFKKWHKIDQLPKFKKLLLELKDMENYRTLQEIEPLYDKIFSLFVESNNFFHPYLITISKNLSDNQIKDIKKHFEDINIKARKSYLSYSKEEYLDESSRNIIRIFQRLGIYLNESQKNKIFLVLSELKDNRAIFLENQKNWNIELISLLRKRKEPFFENSLTLHIDISKEKFDLESNAMKNRKKYFLAIQQVMSSLSDEQKYKFYKKIDSYRMLIDEIITNN